MMHIQEKNTRTLEKNNIPNPPHTAYHSILLPSSFLTCKLYKYYAELNIFLTVKLHIFIQKLKIK